jgi:sugar phosphate permease
LPSEITQNSSENSPRGIYKGWVVVAVSFLSIGGSIGFAQYGFGLFIVPLQEEFGWTRTQINFAITLGVLAHFVSPLIGRTIDVFGSRYVMAVSLGFIAVGFFLRSMMAELWQFYLFSLLVFTGTPGTGLATGRLVQLWFPETRGRMMGFVTAGNNFGGMISIPVLTLVIAFGGWRSGFLFTAIFLGVLSIASFIFVRDGIEFLL